MKILIINGSPRLNGTISSMLDEMASEARRRGADVEVVRTVDLSVAPCTGCMKCRSSRDCCLPSDDGHSMAQKIGTADALIVGAPCYWGNMPGQMKAVFDRLVYAMMEERPGGFPRPLQKGKKAVVVSCCTTAFPFNILFNQSHGAVKALREILRWSGFKIVGRIEKGGTWKHSRLTRKEIAKCRRAVGKLVGCR